MLDLKPCPFCGADAELRNNADERAGDANAHWVTCVGHPSENGCLDTACFDSAEEAVEFWNRRRGEDALNTKLAEVRALAESASNNVFSDDEARSLGSTIVDVIDGKGVPSNG